MTQHTHPHSQPAFRDLEPMYKADASRVLADTVARMAQNPNVPDGELAQHAVELAEALVAGMAVIQNAKAFDNGQ